MSSLTRILNNQITNSTIIASQKIVPGSITGSLFASNVTVPGDFLVTGNLFVLGTSAYTTIASTNTYVNDPLIVLNNGFAGTNTYDEGLIFNRGSSQNRALIWSEYFQEFRLIGTTETGTAYGNVAVSNYQNLRIGNLAVGYDANVTTVTASGNITQTGTGSLQGADFAGNVALNGPYVTTSQGLINFLDSGVTTVNVFGAATAIDLGATTGTLTINNPTVVGTQSTLTLYNTTTATLDAFQAVTSANIGATTGTFQLNNPTLVGYQDTQNLYNTVATTMNFAGAATTFVMGATSGVAHLRNANIWLPNATSIDGAQTDITVLSQTATNANVLIKANVVLGANVGVTTIQNPTLVGTQTTQNLYNTIATTVNAFGAATTINAGAATGTVTINNQVLALPNAFALRINGANPTLESTATGTLNLFNANITTVNAFGDATSLTIGANDSGNLVIRNDSLFIENNANINGLRDATTTTSAALTVAGGAAVNAGMIVGGTLYANASAGSTQQNSGIGAIVIPTGGISVAGTANIGGYTQINGATQLNNTLTVGGISAFTNTTNSADATGTTGAIQIAGGASIAKDLWVGGNLYAANIIGVSANVITVQDPLLFLAPDHTFPYDYDIGFYSAFTGAGLTTAGNVLQHTALVRNEQTNTWTFASNLQLPGGGHVVFNADTVYDPVKAGNLELTVTTDSTSATTGALIVAGGAGIGGNIFHTGTQLQTSASNYLFANTPTTVDAFKSATTLNVGANSGTLTIGNPTVVGTQATQNLYNTVADTINFGRAANITMGINAGITTVQGNLTVQSVRESTSTSTGALTLSGGLGLAGNIFQSGAYYDTSAGNFVFAATPTSANLVSAATTVSIGATSGTLTLQNPTIDSIQPTVTLLNTSVTTLNFAGAATTLVAGATSGIAHLRNANIWLPNATSLDGSQTDINIFTQTATNANVLTRANVILGGNVGVTTIQNTTIRLPNASNIWVGTSNLEIANSGVTALEIGSDATYIGMGASTGDTNVRNSLQVEGVLYANVAAESTTSANGGLVVRRGAGIGGSLNVANSAAFNTGLTTGTFEIKSSTSGNVAFFANLSGGTATTESVIIGGGNTTVQAGVTLKVGSQTTMMLPVGPTAARPSSLFGNVTYDVPGMIRFNSTINNLEFYDGTQWQVTGSTFTVISGRQFSGNVAGGFGNVDGTNTTFTLQATATTASTIISINGVMQFPTLAYSVTGDQLEFTEPPAPNDVIDARILTTTSTVSSITNGNGANQFLADDDGASILTGPGGGSVERLYVDVGGNINVLAGSKITYDQSPRQVTNTNLTLLDRFSANAYTTAKYVISMKQDTGNVQAMEALLTQSTVGSTAGTAYVTTYGIVNTGNTMGTLAANVDVSGGWAVNLWLIPNAGTAISNVKVMTNYIV